ncbi:MAG: hypothetical protein KJ955_07770 [Nanoarchaeota archaeon]|nr:hypothetical protein [Nanoarchaeota archaeon]
MARTVVLPRDIEKRLDNLALLSEEVDGVLFYRQRGEYCPIDSLFMLGIGSEGHVRPQTDRVEVANEFFERNPDYRYVMFHTHTIGTIRKHGNYFARNFSQQDIDEFRRQIGFDANYIGMLVTPETKLLYGIDNPSLVTVESLSGYQRGSSNVNTELHRIARELGCNLENFRATGGGL